MITIFENVRRLCAKNELSISSLEHELGFGNKVIYRWSETNPGIDKLIKVADYFGVSLDELCGRGLYNRPAPEPLRVADETAKDYGDKTTSADFGSMTAEENRILELFRSLNEEGQEHALAVLEGLAASGIYKKRDISGVVEA